jgi:hypothetical protein
MTGMGRLLTTIVSAIVGIAIGIAAVWYAGTIGGFLVVVATAVFLVLQPSTSHPPEMHSDD